MFSPQIFKRDTAGNIRTWQYEVYEDRYRTIAGLLDGGKVTSAWTACHAKNAGKSNYVTAFEQALNEAIAEENKKLKREYRRTIAELDDVMQGPMLAATYKGNLKFPVFSQPKLDGIRALISEKGAFTRELQPHFNVAHIMEDLSSVFAAFPGIVLDGELYNHDLKDNFNRICQLVRKQTVTSEQRADIERLVQFHVYDIANDRESFGQRALAMQSVSRLTEERSSIRWVHTNKLSSQEALDEQNGIYTSQGYEGQMVRLDAPYEFDARSKALLKRKEFETSEFKLLAIEQGEGNWAGYAKRITFELEDGRQCGGGIRGSQEEMRALIERAENVRCPTHVTVRYFKRTPDGMPRFPVAIDFHNGRVD
jgi:ATP-dependent DNA ligase